MIAVEEEKYFQADDKAELLKIGQRQDRMIGFFMNIKLHKMELATILQEVEKIERKVNECG